MHVFFTEFGIEFVSLKLAAFCWTKSLPCKDAL
jgi:hypothetical protein